MDNFTRWNKLFRQLTMLGQFGVSLVTPTLMCLFVCYLLRTRLAVGSWVYIPGFILGLGASGMTAYKFCLSVMNDTGKEDRKSGVSFNRHH